MKVRFNRQEMGDALSVLCSVASPRTPKEILKCVRVEARPDVLLLSATDLEISLRCAVTQVEIDRPGEILVVAETFSKIVRECTDDTLGIELLDNTLHIRGAGSHFQIVTQDVTEFPPIPGLDGQPDFTIPGKLLQRLIDWTVFAAARESSRYAINGVLWEIEGEVLTLVSTDGRRLALARGKLSAPPSEDVPNAIVPSKASSLLTRLPMADDATVGVKILPNQMVVVAGGATLGTSLVEGHFPKYQDVIPTDSDRAVRLSTTEFSGALKRAALLTNEESKGVRLSFSEGSLTLSSRAPEQGEATISLPITYDGEMVEIGFNPVFLLDVLRVIRGTEVLFEFKEANRPAIVHDGDDYLYVLMPVNLS